MTERRWFPRWAPVAVMPLIVWTTLMDDHAHLVHDPGRLAIGATIIVAIGVAWVIDRRRSARR